MTADVAAVLATIGFGALVAFQLAIAFGAPFGRASWGGRHKGVLPTRLRTASAVAAVVWSLAALLILGRAGLGPLTGGDLRVVSWVLV